MRPRKMLRARARTVQCKHLSLTWRSPSRLDDFSFKNYDEYQPCHVRQPSEADDDHQLCHELLCNASASSRPELDVHSMFVSAADAAAIASVNAATCSLHGMPRLMTFSLATIAFCACRNLVTASLKSSRWRVVILTNFVLGETPKSFVPHAFFSRGNVREVSLNDFVRSQTNISMHCTANCDARYTSSAMNLRDQDT